MVLLLLPTETSKLLAQWQGPFQVVRKVDRVPTLLIGIEMNGGLSIPVDLHHCHLEKAIQEKRIVHDDDRWEDLKTQIGWQENQYRDMDFLKSRTIDICVPAAAIKENLQSVSSKT